MLKINIAATPRDYMVAKILFEEYAAAINIDLGFQHFDLELNSLEQMYGTPQGGIVFISEAGDPIGIVGIRKIDDVTGELKRMYVKPGHQGKGIGKLLIQHALQLAKDRGYIRVKLDTLKAMQPAISLYKQAGFYEIPPYYKNPNDTALFFEKLL